MKKTLVLAILDGFGISSSKGNAIKAAKTPNLDFIFSNNPTTQINASGLSVGLPDGQMGNSEVGHTNIGAGRVVYQDLTRITKSIEDGTFFENKTLIKAIQSAKKNKTSLHVIGLLSDGGVHSDISHLYALMELAKRQSMFDVYLHVVLDGRDTSPHSGKTFLQDCQNKINEIGVGKIATVVGRYFAMDRDNRWDRIEKAYKAIVDRKGEKVSSALDGLVKSYNDGVTDEFVKPMIVDGTKGICKDDSVIFFNFRPDRARELTRAFVDPDFSSFQRKQITPLTFVCMTQYDVTIPNVSVAFEPLFLENTFGEYVSNHGLSQLRIAETEKYAHVTFFFNGGIEKPYPLEERILIPSPKVATYDLKPEMSAFELTSTVVEKIKSGKFDVVILNFANCDMVGHTGVFEAAVKAVETVDKCVGEVYKAVESVDGCLIVTADHGNAEKMLDDDGSPFTAHTTNPVPFCVALRDCSLKEGGRLCDIAPTMLKILGLPQPPEINGESLITVLT